MKKLITLCLALAGLVGTVGAKTIYFADNFGNVNSLKLHLYTGTDNNGWPGAAFPAAQSYTIDGYSVYALDLGNWENFIITFKFNNEDAQRESQSVSSSSLNDGDVIDFSNTWDSNTTPRVALTSALTVYDYTFTVTAHEGVSLSYIYLGQDNKDLNGGWPGKSLTDGNYSHKSFKPSISAVIFHNGNGHQTCDLWAEPGENKYYIASLAEHPNWESWGEAVKTNASGYATYVSYNILTIPSGIAYFATDNGDGSATASALTKPAGSTPMLIKGIGGTIYHFATSWGTVEDPITDTTGNAFVKGSNATIGEGNDANGYNYILYGDALYLADNNYVADNKAYLHLSARASSARVLKFPGDEETSINTITTSMDNADAYYNLSGQRIANPVKGLFIKGGKKVIVK